MVEETFPHSILTMQLHLIVNLVDEIALSSTVHARWMLFPAHFMYKHECNLPDAQRVVTFWTPAMLEEGFAGIMHPQNCTPPKSSTQIAR